MSNHGPPGHIDTLALDGLRGVDALHVVVGHFMKAGCPAIEMTLFYLLSGYTLTLAYGRMKPGEDAALKDTLKFYQNRFARTAPSFYLSNCVAFLLKFRTLDVFWNTLYQTRWHWLVTITLTNTWFTPLKHSFHPFNGPSWTVSTLTSMYLVFPLILRCLKKLSDASLKKGIIILYYLQLVPLFLLFDQDYRHTFTVSRHPLVRMPVFVMGILAGLQRIRGTEQENFFDDNLLRFPLHDILPWGVFTCGKQRAEIAEEVKEQKWRWRVDRSLIIIIIAILCYFNFDFKFKINGFAIYTAGDYLFVYLQLLVVQGLTSDGRRSFFGKILRIKFFTFLGRISMAVYLYHVQVFIFLDKHLGFGRDKKYQPEMVAYKFLVVLMVGIYVTICIEEPARRLLKTTKKPKRIQQASISDSNI